MEIVYELKLDVTYADKEAASGSFPLGAQDMSDLTAKLKGLLWADDLHIANLKTFEIGDA